MILVEGEPEPDTGYDKAWMTVMPETRIYRSPEGKEANFNDLRDTHRGLTSSAGP